MDKLQLALGLLSGRLTSKDISGAELVLLGYDGYHAISTDLLKRKAEEIIYDAITKGTSDES